MKLSTKCQSCWKVKKITYSVKFIGIQKGINFDLKLYNCRACGTTRTKKILQTQVPANVKYISK